MHWSGQNSSAGRIGALVQPATDPVSGQPEAKATPARIVPLPVMHFGFVLSRLPVPLHGMAYWARSRMTAGEVAHFALDAAPESWRDWSARLLPDGEWLTYEDRATEQFRAAVIQSGRLQAVIYVAGQPELPSAEWLKSAFGQGALSTQDRRALLAGQPRGGADQGPIVCACFQVGLGTISTAVAQGATTPKAIGIATRAGTNCGSCLPELKRLAGRVRLAAAAE
jgi:assimilatory nitrate reductase catalytic subunit